MSTGLGEHTPLRSRSNLRRAVSKLYRGSGIASAVELARRGGAPLADLALAGVGRVQRRLGRGRRVLLLADNLLMIQVLGEVWETLEGVPHLRATVVVPRRFRSDTRRFARSRSVHLRRSPWPVRARWWDLVIVADHTKPFAKRVPVVRVQHGMTSSVKRLYGEDYTYGRRRCLRADGTPVYTRMLESSEVTRERVVKESPELEPVVVVVGNLRLDHVRAPGEPDVPGASDVLTVGFMSTFGPHSLLESGGEDLLRSITEMAAQPGRRCVLFTHPNLWSVHRWVADPWDARLAAARDAGVIVVEPHEDPAPWLKVCDVVVSDHTSLSLAAGSLGIPLVYCQVPGDVIPPTSPTSRLMAASGRVASASEIPNAVRVARAAGPTTEARAVVDEMTSYPGESPERVRAVLLDLLWPVEQGSR